MFKKKATQKKLDIEVRVGRANHPLINIVLNGHRTVQDALNAADLVKKDTEIVSVNGKEVPENDVKTRELKDGDRVTLVKHVEGGVK